MSDNAPEAVERPDRLFYLGDGSEGFAGVPRRDLTAADIARLSERQFADCVADNPATGRPLYQKTEPASRKRDEQPPAKDPPQEPAKTDDQQQAPETPSDA